jgi:processive 1,2-diacylglycerol beta-glucosyltransferase
MQENSVSLLFLKIDLVTFPELNFSGHLMKKLCLFLSFFCSTFSLFSDYRIAAQSSGLEAYSNTVLEDVRNLYTITDDYLINFEGKIFSRIAFKDDLHEKLAYKLKDPAYADSMYQAYALHILPTLRENHIESFKKALLQVCQLFGVVKSRSEKALSKALIQEGFSLQDWRKSHKLAWKNFLQETHPDHIEQMKTKIEGPLKIVLITTTASGGNLSVAKALEAYLNQFPDWFEVILLDYETFASKCEPIKVATGKYTRDGIYPLLQQHNCVEDLIGLRDEMCVEVAKYIPHCVAAEMKAVIKQIHPHLIISTRNYYPDDFNLLSLGIPFRMLYCDHEICIFHQDLIGKIDPSVIKFWLPSSSPRFFKSLFEHFDREDLYQRSDDWQTLMNKIALITHSELNEIQQQFEVVGFPVRLECQQIKDEKVRKEIKKKWNLQPDEKGVLVEMGVNGVGVLEDIFNLLKNSSCHSIPIKYFFVCGKNEKLKNQFQQMIDQYHLENTALKRCAILGYIEAADKNELLNICSLIISKPGGSTQAEVTEVQLPMLIMHIHRFWENGNKEKLLEDHLAYEYNPYQPLTIQVEELLQKTSSLIIHIQRPNWKNLILEKLQDFSIHHPL